MNPQWIPLSPGHHRRAGWSHQSDYRFASPQPWAPLLLPELATALAIYPMGFVQRPAGGYQLVVVLGLHEGENLFVNAQGQWLAHELPACYRAYPFSLQADGVGEPGRLVLCFDKACGQFRETPDPKLGASRFFDDMGAPQPPVRAAVTVLQANLAAQAPTQRATDALEQAGLLMPWELPPAVGAGDTRPLLPGLHRVDAQALNTLDAAGLLALRDQSALALAYAQLYSMQRLAMLHGLKQARLRAAATSAPAMPPAGTPDLAVVRKVFEPGESDTVHFNW